MKTAQCNVCDAVQFTAGMTPTKVSQFSCGFLVSSSLFLSLCFVIRAKRSLPDFRVSGLISPVPE